MSAKRYWFVGPNSRIYHTRRDCPGLNKNYLYHWVQSAPFPPEKRRLCKRCERAS